MKILAPEQIKQVDQMTIEREPISSIDLMERASKAFVKQFMGDFNLVTSVHIYCGPGNNGGDGLAIARLLDEVEIRKIDVHVHLLRFTENYSADHLANSSRLLSTDVQVHNVEQSGDLITPGEDSIIIDALFGSGLNKGLRGLPAETAKFINGLDNTVVAVDIPSGVFADRAVEEIAIHADKVYTFQLPKLAFMLPGNAEYIGDWKILDIGLAADAIDEMKTDQFYTTHEMVGSIFKERAKFSHKGSYGHAMIMAGSKGKAGAAILAARSALRSGVGLLTMHVPAGILDIIQETVPEAMCSVDPKEAMLAFCPDISAYSAIGIGPGIGRSEETAALLSDLLEKYDHRLVIDADGLNIISDRKELLDKLPESSILTPHPGEFRRLVGNWKDDYEKLELLKKLSKDHRVIVVLKGAHTCIADPGGHLYFNSTGNSGMATAGSGDSLTGILTGLLAQGYSPIHASIIGVFIHGMAGDLALENEHESSLIASDIIRYIGQAFKHLDDPH